jgi:tRNA A37 threonylcarbamoyladenosine dehydratase
MLTTDSGVVVDCIDRAKLKAEMILHCLREKIPVVTVGGAGGRVDPLAVQLADLSKTSGDPLLKQVRKQVRSALGIRGEKVKKLHVPCIFSTEPLRYPQSDGSCGLAPEAGSNLRMDCASGFGAVTHVTGVFGFAAAAAAVDAVLSGQHD